MSPELVSKPSWPSDGSMLSHFQALPDTTSASAVCSCKANWEGRLSCLQNRAAAERQWGFPASPQVEVAAYQPNHSKLLRLAVHLAGGWDLNL